MIHILLIQKYLVIFLQAIAWTIDTQDPDATTFSNASVISGVSDNVVDTRL